MLEKPLQPIFSDSTSNYIDILETINQPEVVESSLRAPMEQALAAQKRFKIKKTYNLDHFSLEDAKRILVSGVTQKGKKEVSVVSELIAMRDEDELMRPSHATMYFKDLELGFIGNNQKHALFYKTCDGKIFPHSVQVHEPCPRVE
jgi:hypothetical protein